MGKAIYTPLYGVVIANHTETQMTISSSTATKYCQCPKCPKMNRQALAQLVIASLVSTCAVVNGQSADYNPLYIGKMITRTGCNPLHLKRNQNIFPRKVWRSHSQCKRGHICTWWEDNLHPGGNRPKKHRTQKKHKIEWFTITWHCCYKTHWNPLALLHIRLNQCNKENKPM